MENLRLRFAPSPTGALHIGGVRTALYNYLLAKKHKGTFILRIEDTDQTRYVPGAEQYIIEALKWCGMEFDEGPEKGGEYGPYRQSERKAIYMQYALQLVEAGHAYYAFDTAEELDARRQAEKEQGNHTFKYDYKIREEMKNSVSLPKEEADQLLASGTPYTIRLKIPQEESIAIQDLVRGEVVFQGSELDDKVIMKADGMPTYHLANIVDDHLMKITHVIRGEEWLPSTAHHVLLYRFMGWESEMPQFAHLPLILKPNGKGKLSKRDGKKFGFPVFPLAWEGATEEDSFTGFREFGFLPEALINFLAFLGWNPGTEQEIFSIEELSEAFSVEKIGKAGAKFNFDKAKWYNQQYISAADNSKLVEMVQPLLKAEGYEASGSFLEGFVDLLKQRVTFLTDFVKDGYYFFESPKEYDQKTIRKKWKAGKREALEQLVEQLSQLDTFTAETTKATTVSFLEANELGFGAVLPFIRIGISGSTKGPDAFAMLELLGKEEVVTRLTKAFDLFDTFVAESKNE